MEGGSMELIYIFLIALLGSFIQASSGFGYAIITMSLWPLFLPFRVAAIMEIISAFVMLIYISSKMFRHINFKMLLFPLIASFATSVAGVYILLESGDVFMKRIMGGALILLAGYFVLSGRSFKIKETKLNGLVAGGVSGILSGLFNIGGPPIVGYFISVTDDKNEYNSTLQCYFIFSTVYLFIIHLIMGNVTLQVLKYSSFAVLGVIGGVFAGLYVFKILSFKALKKYVYAFMLVVGIVLIIRG